MRYFKKKEGVQGLAVAGILYNSKTITRYNDDAIPADVISMARQQLLVPATEKEFNEANGEAIAKNKAANKEAVRENKAVRERLTFVEEKPTKPTAKPTKPTKPANKPVVEVESVVEPVVESTDVTEPNE